MKISLNWLKEYVGCNLEPEKIEKILSSIGLEVEAMEEVEKIPGGLAGVVVAKVVECVKHPDADKLKVTKVDAGTGEYLQVVCGAPNVAEGQKVLLATVGTSLVFSDGSEVKIKRSKIRGVESLGMICAEDELGLGASHDGIMVLSEDAVIGTPAKEYLKLESDVIFEIGLTPNRVDAASHIGVARDLSAYLRMNGGNESALIIPSIDQFTSLSKSENIKPAKVIVPAIEAAPRYSGLTFTDVKVGPSPEWLQTKLNSIGLRPINNVVDITNFILHETGQPLHAFDYSKIEGGEVVVRLAKEGEKITTLDGIERTLNGEDLVICNQSKAMCIAGVFGGADSGVTESTTSLFLESAYFNPVSVRKTSKRHGLKTDASFRYERGADPSIVPYAMKRAAILICELTGAKIVGEIQESYPNEIKRAEVELNFDRMRSLIGKKIENEVFEKLLTYLEFEIVSKLENGAIVSVPSYRVDVTRECDVVEDVLRIYGYNNIELPERVHASINATSKPDRERVRTIAADFLAANGFYEMMNNSLTKGEYYTSLKTFPADNLVKILNPLSTDLNSMRQTLLLNGLEVVAYNINRQQYDIKLFEMGNVYSIKENSEVSDLSAYKEESMISMFISGSGAQNWRGKTGSSHYFVLKGYMELLFKRFGIDIQDLEYTAAPSDMFAEGLVYFAGEKQLAVMGTVNNKLLKQFGIKQPVYAAEISWKVLFDKVKKHKVLYKELPKYPEVRRDLALLLDENVSFAEIRKLAFKTEKKVLKHVSLFDVYRGDKIPQGKKQYAISFILQDTEKTMTDKFVEDVMTRLLNAFSEKFGASLR